MKNEKSAEKKRIAVYLLLSFGLAWAPWMILNCTVGFENWFSTAGQKGQAFLWITLLSAGSPAIANVLTRLMTKEGFEDGLLRLRLRGNVRYYVIALSLPLLISLAGILLRAGLNGTGLAEGVTGLTASSAVMQAVWISPVMAFNTFGEEYGWRGYLYPKLETLLNRPAAVVTGGIIWGVWHAPLTVEGHNFGKDYPGFPWLGIVLMSVVCVLTGMFLMWLTAKTGSIYPAAIAHSANNNGSYLIASIFRSGSAVSLGTMLVSILPLLVYIVFGVMLFRKKAAAEPEK